MQQNMREKKDISSYIHRYEKNNPVRKYGNLNFWVNSKKYNTVENTHQIILTLASDILSKI